VSGISPNPNKCDEPSHFLHLRRRLHSGHRPTDHLPGAPSFPSLYPTHWSHRIAPQHKDPLEKGSTFFLNGGLRRGIGWLCGGGKTGRHQRSMRRSTETAAPLQRMVVTGAASRGADASGQRPRPSPTPATTGSAARRQPHPGAKDGSGAGHLSPAALATILWQQPRRDGRGGGQGEQPGRSGPGRGRRPQLRHWHLKVEFFLSA
jgi:hypothetical protein